MSYPPSKYSPEFFKPQKPENNSGCCPGCSGVTPEPAPPPRRGCATRYSVSCGVNYAAGGRAATWRSC